MRRIALLGISVGLVLVAGCGGKVVFEGPPGSSGGQGGAGGSGGSSTGTSTGDVSFNTVGVSTGTGGLNCSNATCSVGSDGSCECDANCNGQSFEVDCTQQPDGLFICACTENGTTIAKCQQATATCTLEISCCITSFGLQPD